MAGALRRNCHINTHRFTFFAVILVPDNFPDNFTFSHHQQHKCRGGNPVKPFTNKPWTTKHICWMLLRTAVFTLRLHRSFIYGRASREETANKIQLYNQPLPLLNVFFCKSYRVIIQAMIRVQIRFVRPRRQKLESEICCYYNILSYICSLVLTNPHLHKAGTYKNQCH